MNGRSDPAILTRDFVLVCLATLFFFTAFLFYFPTLPTFVERLGGSESEIGVLIAASSLTALLIRPFVGQVIDAFGSRRLLIAGAAFYVITTAAYNLADSQIELVLVRVMNGVSLGTFVTAGSAYVADIAPVERRGEAIGYYGLANNFAFAIGPLIAVGVMDASALRDVESSINDSAGWLSGADAKPENFSLVFLIAVGFALMSLVMALRLGEQRPAARESLRLTWSPSQFFTRSALFPSLLNFVMSFAFATVVTFVALLARDRGMSGGSSFFFLIYALAIMLMRLVGGRLSDLYGRGSMIVPGLALLALSLLMTGFAEEEPLFWAAALVYGLGAGAAQPALMALAVDLARPEERGRAMGTFTLSNDLGLSVGALALGVILELTNYETTYTVAALIVSSGVLLYLAGRRKYTLGSPTESARALSS